MVRQRPMDASPLRDPGNERADLLAKAGSQLETPCHHARVTKSWIQAQTHSSRWPHPRSFQRNYASTAQLPSALSLGCRPAQHPQTHSPTNPQLAAHAAAPLPLSTCFETVTGWRRPGMTSSRHRRHRRTSPHLQRKPPPTSCMTHNEYRPQSPSCGGRDWVL